MSGSLLFVFEMIPERTDMWFIENPKELPKGIVTAMKAMRGLTINGDDLNPEQQEAGDILLCAMAKKQDAEHYTAYSEAKQKLVGVLEPYLVKRGDQKLALFPKDGKLHVMRAAMFM